MLSLDDVSLERHLKTLETTSFHILEFAMQVLLLPMVHQLQVLVEEQEMERALRARCEGVIMRLAKY